ncbi:MAG: TolC family protein [Acidobacteriota bacterium]
MNARLTMALVVLAATGTATVHGQQPALPGSTTPATIVDPVNGLSLSGAIDRAVAQEPSIVALRHQIDAARGAQRQAGLRPNPTVGFEQRTEPQGTDALTMLTVDWPLDLFRRPAREAVADAHVSAVTFEIADRERRLTGEVRTRYGEVLAAVRELEVLDSVIVVSSRQHELLVARVNLGSSPPLDRDLLFVEVRRLEARRLLQIGRLDGALVALKRLLGMPANAPLAVSARLETVVATEGNSGAQPPDVVSGRPDVREAEARVAVADAAIDQARREGRIDMSLYGTYMKMDAGFPQRGFATTGGLERVRGVFHYVGGGVRVSVPFLNRNQGAVASAQAERLAAQSSLDAARLTADAEVAAARARDVHARSAVQLYQHGLREQAQQNVSVVQQTYDLGRLTLLDVLAEQRRYLDVEQAYSEALGAAYDARTALIVAGGVVR